jgi:hypothetical protein
MSPLSTLPGRGGRGILSAEQAQERVVADERQLETQPCGKH